MIPVFSTKFDRSWPGHLDAPVVAFLDHNEAFVSTYDTDAHVGCYSSRLPYRLGKEAVGTIAAPAMELLVLDVDYHQEQTVPLAWRIGEYSKLLRLECDYPGIYSYQTNGGYRIVTKLKECFRIDTLEDSVSWSQFYETHVNFLSRVYDIWADKLTDWNRMFRLPHVCRAGVGPVMGFTLTGDPYSIEVWDPSLELIEDDRPPVFDLPDARDQLDGKDFSMFRLCYRDGLIRSEQRRDGAWIIECPLSYEHSGSKDSPTCTMLYPPEEGRPYGTIYCRHGGVSGHSEYRTCKDWIDRVPGWK